MSNEEKFIIGLRALHAKSPQVVPSADPHRKHCPVEQVLEEELGHKAFLLSSAALTSTIYVDGLCIDLLLAYRQGLADGA